MKTLNIFAALVFSIFSLNLSFAQTAVKQETIKVSGTCGMCKSKIEKSAKTAGATFASWNPETQILNVSYNPAKSNSEKIQKSVAASGYDTQNFKADDTAYDNLHGCCKYERNTSFTNVNSTTTSKDCSMDCCKGKNCCDKNGRCDDKMCKNMPECKNMDCCKS